MQEVTRLLSLIEEGDPSAAEELLPLVYSELRSLAAAKLSREKSGQSLQPTLLVHEAYLRLAGDEKKQAWNGKAHFFGAAAEAMRRILVDHARSKAAERRGGKAQHFELTEADGRVSPTNDNILLLNETLCEFEQQWPERAQLVKLRYFAGMTIPEASKALKISTATAERWWRFAKAWLHSQLAEE